MHMCETTAESFHLRLFLTNDICLPILMPQTAIFCFTNRIENNSYKNTNYLLLIVNQHVCKSREGGTLELSRLINEIKIILFNLNFTFVLSLN